VHPVGRGNWIPSPDAAFAADIHLWLTVSAGNDYRKPWQALCETRVVDDILERDVRDALRLQHHD
jgi:hypothetical protein